LKKLGIEGTVLIIIKPIQNKPRDNMILNGEKKKQFPLKSGKVKKVCSPPTYSI
jgi:hypothetical protein